MKRGILITIMIGSMLLGLFGCGRRAEMTITSVEEMTLTLTGMRGRWVYQFDGDTEQLRRCREVYSGEEDELLLEASIFCSKQTILDLFSTCEIHRWNGFHGAHPRNVQDGIMFRFEAMVNDGETVIADGSANYPNGYHEFVRALNTMLASDTRTEEPIG